jgi:actinin alpha
LLKVGNPIDDLTTGFKDGLQLIKLVEVISNDKLRKPEKGKMRLHHIQNVNIALDAIAARGVKVCPMSAL